MQKYIIGIDTGGTFTDGVLMDAKSGKVVKTAKRPTTHFQLAVGAGETLAALMGNSAITPKQIEHVAVSSTLATNSVVENRGARVAILVIGYVKHFKLPVKAVLFVKGGHTIIGDEEQPLDVEYLVELIQNLKNEVDAYGVCSAMSMKNPAHELVAEKAISMIDPKPVFCSHRISDIAGMQERAATAGLHAKLMPVMKEFVTGIEAALTEHKLTCPMVVIGGNGTTIKSAEVVAEAGLTVASGPACTAHFGANHTNGDSLVVDVGGTTTDISMIENGVPRLADTGCQIGRWRTHVEAIDMHTGGVGGDSYVQVNEKGEISLHSLRVTPVSMAQNCQSVTHWLGTGDKTKLIGRQQNRVCNSTTEKLETTLDELLDELLGQSDWSSLATIKEQTQLGGITLEKKLEQLSRKQLIFECGFTPTDALHVLGLMDFGNRAEAALAAEILGKAVGLGAEEFCRKVIAMTEEKIENLIIDYVIQRFWGNSLTGFISSRKSHPVLGVDFSIRIPIIGIGAAARHFLPKVAENLGTTVNFPENCEVGNAIGAGLILQRGMHETP